MRFVVVVERLIERDARDLILDDDIDRQLLDRQRILLAELAVAAHARIAREQRAVMQRLEVALLAVARLLRPAHEVREPRRGTARRRPARLGDGLLARVQRDVAVDRSRASPCRGRPRRSSCRRPRVDEEPRAEHFDRAARGLDDERALAGRDVEQRGALDAHVARAEHGHLRAGLGDVRRAVGELVAPSRR